MTGKNEGVGVLLVRRNNSDVFFLYIPAAAKGALRYATYCIM